jgi:glycosyltransferase involved in cell wall biosynthesis
MSLPASPDISVIVPVYNRDEVIRYTLKSVRRGWIGYRFDRGR